MAGNDLGLGEQARLLMEHRQAIAKLASSQDARQLMELLRGMGGVEQAAQQAAGGNADALKQMVAGLMNSQEGAALAQRLGEQAKQVGLGDV